MYFEQPFEGFWLFIAVMVGMITWRLWGDKIKRRIADSDRRKIENRLQFLYDKADPRSHFRQSVDQINEDTAPIERLAPELALRGVVARWNGREFSSLEEAENARWQFILNQAREFYTDLDLAYGHRIQHHRTPNTKDPEP